MSSVWGYARVSREDQNLALQLDALEAAGVIQANVVEEKESGTRQRPGFNALLKRLQPGDSLVAWKVDRLGRDALAALTIASDDRTLKRQRAEIRALLGFREATIADAEDLSVWLRDAVAPRTRDMDELATEAEARCRALRVEPPSPERVARIVRAAVRAHDERRYAAVHARLSAEIRARLDALLQAASPETADAAGAETDPETQAAPLIHLRSGPGRASVASLRDELARLDLVRRLELPDACLPNGARPSWKPAASVSPSKRPLSCAAIPRPLAMPGSRPMPTCAVARSPTRLWIC